MGIEVPEFVNDISPWVLGSLWPEGDETAMRRLAAAWEAAAKDADAALKSAGDAVDEARGRAEGDATAQVDELWKKFVDGDAALFTPLKEGSEQLAKACRDGASQVEYAKLSIVAALAALRLRTIAMAAAAYTTSGASLAGILPAQTAARQVIVTIHRDLARRLGEQVDKDLPRRVPVSSVTKAAISGVLSGSLDGGQPDLAGGDTGRDVPEARSGPTPSPRRPAAEPAPPKDDDLPLKFSGQLDLPLPDNPDTAERQKRLPDRLKEIERLVRPTAAGVVIEPASPTPEHPTHFVVDVLGSPDKVMAGDRALDAQDTGDVIRASGWDGKKPVLLVGGQTGAKPDGFAAELARELGGEVTAPGKDVWTDSRGNLFTSSLKDMRPSWPPNGHWATFKPDGTNTPHADSHPPGHTPDWRDVADEGPRNAYRRGEAPGSVSTSPPSIADKLDLAGSPPYHAKVDDTEPVVPQEERKPRTVAPENTPLFFENKPDFRATQDDVRHMRRSYPPEIWLRDAEGIDQIIADHQHLQRIPRDQLIALRGYTADHAFDAINNALRTNDITTLRRFEGHIRVLNSALNQLPPVRGVVHRVIKTGHGALRAAQYPLKAVVTERGFLSSSTLDKTRLLPGRVEMQIHSLTGRDISMLSHNPGEREVLFPSGTRFRVTGKGYNPHTDTYYLQLVEEAAPPLRPPRGPARPPQSHPVPPRSGPGTPPPAHVGSGGVAQSTWPPDSEWTRFGSDGTPLVTDRPDSAEQGEDEAEPPAQDQGEASS